MHKVPSRTSPVGCTRANAKKTTRKSGWVNFEALIFDKVTRASINRKMSVCACNEQKGIHPFNAAYNDVLGTSGKLSKSRPLNYKKNSQALTMILVFAFVISVDGQSLWKQTSATNATQVSSTQDMGSTRPTTSPTTKRTQVANHTSSPLPDSSQLPSTYPSPFPSMLPSTPEPTDKPSLSPSVHPSGAPSDSPTTAPTLNAVSTISRMYTQKFEGEELKPMNASQIQKFELAFANYTFKYSDPVMAKVETVCEVSSQGVSERRRIRHLRKRGALTIESFFFSAYLKPSSEHFSVTAPKKRALQSTAAPGNAHAILVDYSIQWSSRLANLEDDNGTDNYADLFESWVNKNTSKEIIRSDLLGFGMPVEVVDDVFVVQRRPTPSPTAAPSYPVSAAPTSQPSVNAAVLTDQTLSIIIGATSAGATVIVTALVTALALFLCARRRNAVIRDNNQSTENKKSQVRDNIDLEKNSELQCASTHESNPEVSPPKSDSRPRFQESSTSDLLVSGTCADLTTDFAWKESTTRRTSDELHIADEFDTYKNQKLEEMRSTVEGAVTDMDSMMSQALTRALMDDDDASRDVNDLVSCGAGDSMEIEAFVLCETNSWLKRTEDASLEERRTFMQNLLNKMVAIVRFNIIAPEKASRTIHGAAAMLGLQLAGEIPETTIIVTGMRKKAQKDDVLTAFQKFGMVEDAAVSPDERGFGLVRYVSPKSARRAMECFRTDEIVVQDVSVNLKLMSEFVPRQV